MSRQQQPAPEQPARYAVGDTVYAKHLIASDSIDGLIPAGALAYEGDELRVVMPGDETWHLYVAHPGMKPGQCFGVYLDDVRPDATVNPI